MTAGKFFEIVIELCLLHHGSITSGIRTVKRNLIVGGTKHSHHLSGFALDVVLDDWIDKRPFIDAAKKAGLVVIDEVADKNHLHVHVPRPTEL